MALPGYTPQQELDLYYLIRNIAWRLQIDEAEALLAADISRILREVRAEAERLLLRIDPDELTPETVAAAMAGVAVPSGEDNKPTLARDAIIAGVAITAGLIFDYSLREQSDILSVGGLAKNVASVTTADIFPALAGGVADRQKNVEQMLAAFFRETQLSSRTLPQWVDGVFNAGLGNIVKVMDDGIAKGKTHRQIVRSIMAEVESITEREAITLARTYAQSAAVAAQEAVYEANADIIDWLEWSAIMEAGYKDTGHGTCIRCSALDGMRWRPKDKNRPPMPLHWRCRCSWRPVIDWGAAGIDEAALDERVRPWTIRPPENIDVGGGRAILDAGQATGSWGAWAGDMDAQFKINAIGRQRYEMWQRSGLPFDEFAHLMVDRRTGALYTIPQLEGRLFARAALSGDAAFIRLNPAANLREAVVQAQLLGVKAGYEGDLGVARLVNDALAEAKTKGYLLPSRVVYDADVFAGDPYALAGYKARPDTLYLRPGQTATQLVQEAATQGGKGFWSSSAPSHAIIHEVGHAAHFKNDPTLYRRSAKRQFSPVVSRVVEREVSGYATDNGREFVAEVFAGILGGKTYPKRIMQLYKAYGGVWK